MSDTQNTSQIVPVWFWIVSVGGLLWNLLGVMAFFMQVMISPEILELMPEAERALMQSTPGWAMGAFAIAVFCGTIGCIGLLLRQRWAKYLFVLSLLGIIAQNINAFFIQDSFAVFGPGGTMMVGLVALVALGLILLSVRADNNGWLS